MSCFLATPALAADLPDHHPGDYTLTFSDEFNGTSLDRTKWCTRYAYGGGMTAQVPDVGCTGPDGFAGTLDFLNDEQQRYVDFNTLGQAMHVEAGGTLTLRATKTRNDSYASWESSMLRSKVEFKPTSTVSYYIAARLRLPDVIGTWPAMWLAGGFGTNGQIQWPPEIDIFEGALNGVEDTNKMMRMGAQARGGKQTNSGAEEITFSMPGYDRTWDNYFGTSSIRGVWMEIGAQWTADSVCYFVDGVKAMCENYRWSDDAGVAANPASLLLNLAIGGAWAGRYGVAPTGFPAGLEADFVRVYSSGSTSTPPPPPPPPPPATNSYLIDAGSSASYKAADGRTWQADQGFLGAGGVVDRGAGAIANTGDPKLYQTERWCMDGYSLPIATGSYAVKLHFAETSPNITAAGGRLFDVAVEGQSIGGLDVFKEAGGARRALIKTFGNVPVTDGALTIGFTKHADCPMIDAIEVQPVAPAAAPLLIDAGGFTNYVATDGRVWLADQGYVAGAGSTADRGAIAIANTTEPSLFRTERYCAAGYNLARPNGSYLVNLYFAETFPWINAGGRVFDVSVEGQVISNLDVFNEAGGRNRALIKTLSAVTVTDGVLTIGFTAKTDCPIINAIEVLAGR